MKSYAECIIDCFNHKPYDRVIWQPRYNYWFKHYAIRANENNFSQYKQYVPQDFIGKDNVEIAEEIGASIRYANELSIQLFNRTFTNRTELKFRSVNNEDQSQTTYIETPVGNVSRTVKNGYDVEHLIKSVDDLKVIQYMVENTEFTFNEQGYQLAMDVAYPDFGLPTAYYFRSPYMRCVIEFMGFEKTIILLRRHPREMEAFMNALEDWDRKQYENVICKCPLKWVNFGENIDGNLSPPGYFKKYLLEYYHSRVKLLKNAGKFSFIHIRWFISNHFPIIT